MAITTEAAGGRVFPRLHWGAVIAGVLLALAAHVVLGLIGAALGFGAGASDSPRAVGAAAAIWGLITPFVATLLGAWLACRLAAAEEARAAGLHGVLVWCIGLIAGAIFLTGTMATGAMTAGTAASGNAGAAQRQLRAETGQARPSGPQARAGSENASKAAATTAGGGALAAIAGLLGGICGAAIVSRGRGRGRGFRAWRTEDRREAGDRGHATGYTSTEMPSARSPGSTLGESELPPPTDPYHH